MKMKHDPDSVMASVKAQKLISGTRDFDLLNDPGRAVVALNRKVDDLSMKGSHASDHSSLSEGRCGRSAMVKLTDALLRTIQIGNKAVKVNGADLFNQEFKKVIKHKG